MLPFIEGDPDYEGINEMIQLLYANVTTLPTPQVGGNHGHIGRIMNPMLYTTLTTTEWTNPPSPVVYPMIPKNTTADLQEQLQLQYDKGRRIYDNMVTMDKDFNNQVIETAKDMYLKELKNN